MQRVLVLPGSSGPEGSEKYRQIYITIEGEAARRGIKCQVTSYPGQRGISSGLLTYSSALQSTLQECREYRPDWIIGRSLGCAVAIGILSSEESWVRECEGAVLCGPCLRATVDRLWPTDEIKQKDIAGYKEYNTYLALDFFDSLPAIEQTIQAAQCNLRLVRGTLDIYNSSEDLAYLAKVHQQMQPHFSTEVVEIEGVDHGIPKGDVSSNLFTNFMDSLFNPIKKSAP